MALGKDLAEIREELGVDTDEIQGLTKLSYEIIAEIESDAIFNSEIYNDAYIRNFVRSYARGLKIKEAVILRALDAMEQGSYDHGIFKDAGAPNPTDPFGREERKRNLEEESAPKKAPIRTELNYDAKTKVDATNKALADAEAKEILDIEISSKKATGQLSLTDSEEVGHSEQPPRTNSESKTTKKSAVVSTKEAAHTTDGEETNATEEPETKVDSNNHSEDLSREAKETPIPEKKPSGKPPTSTTKTADKVNWAQMGKRFNAQQESKSNVVLITILAIITVSLLVFAFLYRSTISSWFAGFSEAPSENTTEVTDPNSGNVIIADSLSGNNLSGNSARSSQDSEITGTTNRDEQQSPNSEANESETSQREAAVELAQAETAPLDSIALQNLAQFPDTLQIVIYAAYDKLDPVRVGSDLRESVFPLWMEQGEAYYFDFNEEITIRGQFSRMLILFNNTVIEAPLERFSGVQENTVRLTRERLAAAEFEAKPDLILPDGVSEPDSIVYAIDF
ncbi:MAG: helix-turn-helix domain-containing protein [Bacteroidetes bacterium]|nr:helix-turn-helix domain-containing protein [Bacteroidota bacterium]